MNNSDFRQLLLSNPDKTPGRSNRTSSPPSHRTSSAPLAFGSRKAFVPRNIRAGAGGKSSYALRPSGSDDGSSEHARPAKKAKTLDLGRGYTDRALARLKTDPEAERDEDDDEDEDKERRIRALARKVVEGQLEEEEFERMREEIAGGDVGSTHLVRGLDRRLLERVRKGEDVLGDQEGEGGGADAPDEEGDEEFEELEGKEVRVREKEGAEKKKKGELNTLQMPTPPTPGTKKSRDEILAEFKRLRAEKEHARLQARPELGDKFRKIEERKEKPRTVVDSKGREVIITRDEQGNVKRKVRKVPVPDKIIEEANRPVKFLDEDVIMPKQNEVPAEVIEEDPAPENMFDDVQDDYDPLAGLMGDDDDDDDDSSSNDVEGEEGEVSEPKAKTVPQVEKPQADRPIASDTLSSTKPRNYFSGVAKESDTPTDAPDTNPFHDPAFLSAISRAGNMAKFKMQLGDGEDGEVKDGRVEEEDEDARLERLEKEARLRKKREMLMASMGRDDEDLDLGFGGGRFDDDDGDDDGKIKLSEWGKDDEESRKQGGKSKEKKKRSKGKRKGDKDSAQDVLEVMRRRQEN